MVTRVTRCVDPEQGVWVTECCCEPGCAEYRCCSCQHEWGSTPSREPCLECGSIHFEWVNYASWCKTHT